VWLTELSEAAGQRLTLADVPAAAWDDVTPAGVDAVWLMGVWQRSPAGLALAMANPDLLASFRDALPDLTSSDVIGSPYCVRGYLVDAAFGGPDALAAAHTALRDRGVSLLLDYVPNHVAPDHPWVSDSPELFVRGSEDDIQSDPASWLRAGSNILARGRDPYFPPWPDVVQLNAFSPALRATAAETLAGIAAQCDGIRCDMAMLMTNKVFANTWAGRAGAEPVHEFWPEVIAGMRARHPDTVLIAEAYWDMEWDLQEDGFDFCYDKRLYDRIVGEDANAVRDHLRADLSYQRRLLRFLENHDEPRIASRIPPEAQPAAAVAIPRCPVRRFGTRGNSRVAAYAHRSSWAAARTRRSMPSWPSGTGAYWLPSIKTACGPANGGCSRSRGGGTTSPAATCWPGCGAAKRASTDTWW
jgi:glycosidase